MSMAAITQWVHEPAPHRSMSTEQLLIIGGSGFLGGRTRTWAMARDIAVDATFFTNAPDAPTSADRSHWHRCDILDVDALGALFEAVQPTAVINTAYRQSGEDAVEICSTGAANVARACAEHSARLVHVSTDLVFDGELGRPYREDDVLSPISQYGSAKAQAEQLVLSANPDSAVVRTSLIYGSADAPQERLVTRAANGEDISFFTDEWRNPIHVDSLAFAVGQLARDHTFTGIVHVAGDERVNRLEFARFLAESLSLDPSGLTGSPADPSLGPRSSDVALENGLAKTLGFDLPGPSVTCRNGVVGNG